MDTPSRTVKIQIQNNSYDVSFPNNGQLIDIESLKIKMSNDTHGQMLFGTSNSSNAAYILVETIATYSILIPQLKQDLKVKSLLDLDFLQTKELTRTYNKIFYPWYKSWWDYINKPEEKEQDGEADSNKAKDAEKNLQNA